MPQVLTAHTDFVMDCRHRTCELDVMALICKSNTVMAEGGGSHQVHGSQPVLHRVIQANRGYIVRFCSEGKSEGGVVVHMHTDIHTHPGKGTHTSRHTHTSGEGYTHI